MTSTHDWFVENREAYALWALEPEEQAAFDDHLPRCAQCREAMAELERDLGPLAFGVRPVPVPPGLRQRISDAVLGGAFRRPSTRVPWLIAAAAVLASAVVGGRAWKQDAALRTTLAAAEAQNAALADSLSIVTHTSKVMQASFTGGNGSGGLVVLADEQSHRWRVVVHGPAAPDGMSYLVCFITPNGLLHAVTVGRGGQPASFTLGMPADGTPVLGAALLLQADTPPAGTPMKETPIAEVRL